MDTSLYADFQNVDPEGRIRLNTTGILEDLARHGLTLTQGRPVQLYTDDGDSDRGLAIDGIVELDSVEGSWVAHVDWSRLVRIESQSLATTS